MMRIKLVFLAGSLAAFVIAVVFGADMCAQVGQIQSESTVGAGEEAAEAAGGQEVPNVTEGGVGKVNQNLRELKTDMQEQMDQRQDDLDDRLERSGANPSGDKRSGANR
jgi:hypothetical protein